MRFWPRFLAPEQFRFLQDRVQTLLPAFAKCYEVALKDVRFRKQFFTTLDVWCVANFANLAEVLFAGRSRVPAAAFFYSPRTQATGRLWAQGGVGASLMGRAIR